MAKFVFRVKFAPRLFATQQQPESQEPWLMRDYAGSVNIASQRITGNLKFKVQVQSSNSRLKILVCAACQCSASSLALAVHFELLNLTVASAECHSRGALSRHTQAASVSSASGMYCHCDCVAPAHSKISLVRSIRTLTHPRAGLATERAVLRCAAFCLLAS